MVPRKKKKWINIKDKSMRVVSAALGGEGGMAGMLGGDAGDETARVLAAAAAADVVSGPPPRLLKSPPKLETLPSHIFSPEERGKIRRLRCFFDSLQIADEKEEAPDAAPADDAEDSKGRERTKIREKGAPDNCCPRDGNESNASVHASSGLSSPNLIAARDTEKRGGCASSCGCPGSADVVPPSAASFTETAAAASCGGGGETTNNNNAEVKEDEEVDAAPVTSSWFRWSFIGAAEPTTTSTSAAASAAAALSTSLVDKEKTKKKKGQGKEEDKDEELKLCWEEMLWLEDDLILARYLRSYNWDTEEARKQLLRTLLWRQQQKPQHLSPNQVSTFARKGSVYRKGFDIYGRGVIYFKPGRDSCTGSDVFQRYVVYTIERALESLDRERGVDQLVFIVDFSEWGIMQISRTDVSRDIVSILNDHYTDVLAAAFIVNAPSYFDPLWRLVSLMVHPDTAKKVVFVNNTKQDGCSTQTTTTTTTTRNRGSHSSQTMPKEDCAGGSSGSSSSSNSSSRRQTTSLNCLRELIPHPFLEECVGGESSLDYDHDAYWQAEKEQFLRVCIHRRQQLQSLQHSVRTRRKQLRRQQQQQGQQEQQQQQDVMMTTAFSGNAPDPESCAIIVPAIVH